MWSVQNKAAQVGAFCFDMSFFFVQKKCIFLINARLGSLEREKTHKTIFAKYKYNRLSTEDGD